MPQCQLCDTGRCSLIENFILSQAKVLQEHVVPQVIEAIYEAVEGGFSLPIVYNTSSYDSMRSLELLDGLVGKIK